jgi:hypothetical protein
VLGVVLGALWSASGALASATMTYPADRATVSLDQQGSFTFRWTLPAGEMGPQIWVGDQPTYDPETFAPFGQGCGAARPDQVTYSCRMAPPSTKPLPAGTHYAFIQTDDGDPVTRYWYSPVTRFVVPPKLGWGCGPAAGCNDPAVHQAYNPQPNVGPPESDMFVRVWVNSPGAPVTATFTLRNGNRVVARIVRTAHADSDFFSDPGFMVFQVGDRGPYRTAVRLHGIHGVKWLRVTAAVRAKGLTITRIVKFRAPPG